VNTLENKLVSTNDRKTFYEKLENLHSSFLNNEYNKRFSIKSRFFDMPTFLDQNVIVSDEPDDKARQSQSSSTSSIGR
jgi:hypothetical protein